MLVHSKWDSSNASLVPRAGWSLSIGLVGLCLTLSSVSAQAPLQLTPPALKPYAPNSGLGSSAAPSASAPTVDSGSAVLPPRVAGKAAISSAGIASAALDRSTEGATYVALASGLQSVFSGREPSTLQELKALELQQSRVAQAIERVTVNVQQGSAQGSGVIITADGYVLTAAHVAGDKDRDAVVILNDGTRLAARTLGLNRDKDAGLLKIKENRLGPLPYATIGRSSDLQVGQWCIASGHPGGWKPERGAVIRVGRVLKLSKGRGDQDAHTLFSDCALIGGDSGGPLFTLEGRLIGIHSRIGTDVEDNMHVPIDVFAVSWDRMVNREVWGMLPGYQPVIGVEGTGESDRPKIAKLAPDGPALKAGLQVGDVILACDGVAITTFDELRHYVERTMPGDVIVVKLRRGEQILQLPITVGVRER
jgi:serine protease Do